MSSWDDLLGFAHSHIDGAVQEAGRGYGMKLAVEELLSNIIRANSNAKADTEDPATIEISIFKATSSSKPSFILQTKDNGLKFDPHFDAISSVAKEIPIAERQPGGLGLFLIKTSVDDVSYSYRQNFNIYQLISHDA